MHAAGIVAQHPTDCAMTVRSRVGAEDQSARSQLILQVIEDQSRFNASELCLHINFNNSVHVLGEVEDHRDIAALAGETGAAAATCNRRAKLATDCDGGDYVTAVARDQYADWNLPIIRTVCGIKRAVAIAEAHFATNIRTQFFL